MYIVQLKKTKGLLAAIAQGGSLGKEAESSNLSGSTILKMA